MSETELGRALQFMQEPQDVEVYRSGGWVFGSMIGWRREEGSSCRIMVRLTERGEEKTAWADLQDVRLAEDGAFPGTQSLPFLPVFRKDARSCRRRRRPCAQGRSGSAP